MTAARIEAALVPAPRAERITLAARLIAYALMDDELDEAVPRLPEDPELLIGYLHAKLASSP